MSMTRELLGKLWTFGLEGPHIWPTQPPHVSEEEIEAETSPSLLKVHQGLDSQVPSPHSALLDHVEDCSIVHSIRENGQCWS